MRQWSRVIAAIALMSTLVLCLAAPAGALQSGDRAPEFALPATTADKISLGQYLGRKHVVVFFYIAAFGQA
jgi:AhpC/TSA family